MKANKLWIFVAMVALTIQLQAQNKTMTAFDVARLRIVTSAEIHPSGDQVAYTLSVPRNPLKVSDGSAFSELHIVNKDGESRPFITGEVSIRSISWSPDGEKIYFLTKRKGDKATSLYAIAVGGGEAQKVFEHKTSISSYDISSDGKQLAFIAVEPDSDEVKKRKDQGFTQQIYEEDVKFGRVWTKTLGDDKEPRMYKLDGSASQALWSPNATKLLVTLARTPLVDDHYMMRRVHVADVKSGKIVSSLNNPGKLGDIAWSPDGKHIAIISGVDINDPADGRLWLYSSNGGKLRDLVPDYDGHITSFAWNSNNSITYLGDRSVWTEIGRVSLGGESESIVPLGKAVLAGCSLADDGTTLATVGNAPQHPGEVVVYRKGKPTRLTNHNPWLKDIQFAQQELVKHKARDGIALEGILIRPLGAKSGKRYPLILAVHGGPEAHISNGWTTYYSRPGQVAAAEGFAVFYPNYRGSTGRGVAFSKMGQADAAGKEFNDLVDAVDHLVGMGLVDKKKVGITGGSYGGYASAWGATYFTKHFAASVMFVGISDNFSKVGTTDIPYEMFHVHHRKFLWDDPTYFVQRSPISYVEQARTPILIMHGKEDPRVHPSQSLELYRHLKVLGKVPVRLVFYPGEGHGNRRAASRLDYNLRMMRWMRHYLQGPGGKAPPYQLQYEKK